MEWIYPLNTGILPEIHEIGGKSRALILLTQKDFPVPPGFVLTVGFFEPWFEEIEKSAEWAAVSDSPDHELKSRSRAVQALCPDLELDEERRKALLTALDILRPGRESLGLAVRSSSPEEDLKGASFAGGYETVLGVSEDAVLEALRGCFASSLDERVIIYKREHGFPAGRPRLAIIVQQQIDSEISGVAFSLNPINNCYDEAVVNANFGLGESVVSGTVSPDAFIVDKVAGTIIEKKRGEKQSAFRLDRAGGTIQETNHESHRFCLSDRQVMEVTGLVGRVEGYFGHPVDIEWAYVNNILFLLQARPITAYIPLPEAMLTRPGDRKRLYLDGSLAGQGIDRAMSVLGTDFMAVLQDYFFNEFLGGAPGHDPVNGLYATLEGRMYVSLSNQLKLTGLKSASRQLRTIDTLSAEILSGIDLKEYIPKRLPSFLRGLFIPKAIMKNAGAVLKALKAYRKPDRYLAELSNRPEIIHREIRSILLQPLSIKQMTYRTLDSMMKYVRQSLPTFGVSEFARFFIKRILKSVDQSLVERAVYLERAFPANTTIQMGFAMYELSRFEEIKTSQTWPDLKAKMEADTVSRAFLTTWNDFMENYGFRCPMEMDIATPRYHENPSPLFDQLRAMADSDQADNNPKAIFDLAARKREETLAGLKEAVGRKSKWKAKKLEHYYQRLVAFGGYREVHKYHMMWLVDRLRRKILDVAQTLTDSKRLDSREQAFDLTLDDLEAVFRGENIDLHHRIEKNTEFIKTIRHIRSFPRIIDSRGKIFNVPKQKYNGDDLFGEPISPGIVRGKVKVFHTVDEKRILPGEILVARATDPGWTPLFVNAAGIVLEVGGLLQHGALVAREYGKPCIAGIPDVTERFQDGQTIEMDGLTGEIRFV